MRWAPRGSVGLAAGVSVGLPGKVGGQHTGALVTETATLQDLLCYGSSLPTASRNCGSQCQTLVKRKGTILIESDTGLEKW